MDNQILHTPDHTNPLWGELQMKTNTCNTFVQTCEIEVVSRGTDTRFFWGTNAATA